MRRQIQKQLHSRSVAIKAAIRKYNQFASLLDPPRQPLDISQVLDYAFLAEFDLLKNSHENVCDQPWALPVNREYTQHYFKLQAAKEEIIRLNIEIQRLFTSIQDEDLFFSQKIAELQHSDPPLAYAIEQRWKYRKSINETHIRTFHNIEKLPGYSGRLVTGKRRAVRPVYEEMACDSMDTIVSSRTDTTSFTEIETSSDGELSENDEVVEIASALESWHIALE